MGAKGSVPAHGALPLYTSFQEWRNDDHYDHTHHCTTR